VLISAVVRDVREKGVAVPADRAGFTLVELLITMALISLVAGAIVTLLVRQQRFYRSTSVVIDTRQQLRQAASMLPSDLRGISSIGGDIYAMSDSSLEFRSTFGGSIVCVTDPGKKRVTTVPRRLAKGSVLTSWSVTPSIGDSVAIYNDSTSSGSADDVWSLHQITKVTIQTTYDTNGCPVATGLVQLGDLSTSNPSYELGLSPAQSINIKSGAGMRFFRRVHYSIYYQASDAKWYLGYYDCVPLRLPAVCTPIRAIAGPFQPYATNGTSGLQFAYFDSTGAVTTTRSAVARISLVARGKGETLVNLTGGASTVFGDSLRIEVGLRNRR